MATDGFVCASLVSVFIAPNASSLKINLCLGIVRWRKICAWHRISFGTWLDNHPFYLCPLKDSCHKVKPYLFFDFIDAVPKIRKLSCSLQLPGERELLPENSVKAWFQYNWSVYGEKTHTLNTQRAFQTSAGSSCCSESKLSMCNVAGILAGIQSDRKFKFYWFYFPSP